MKELSIEEKAKAYDGNYKAYTELINRLEDVKEAIKKQNYGNAMDILCKPYPGYQITTSTELKESEDSEDEKTRTKLLNLLKELLELGGVAQDTWSMNDCERFIAWLEKQGEQSKWKPSKDEMGALYGLAYITNKMDDKKDEAVTKLYQDLKREFFNGASYENMFPSSPVNSDINIKKQGEQKPAEWSEEDKVILNNIIWGVHMKSIKPLDEMDDRSKYKKYEDFLKSLPKRFSLHPRQELSEEDIETISRVISIVKWAAYSDHSHPILNDEGATELVKRLKSLKERYTWKPSDLPHWKKSNLPNHTTTGFNSDYFCHKGYCINYKELFEKLPKDD